MPLVPVDDAYHPLPNKVSTRAVSLGPNETGLLISELNSLPAYISIVDTPMTLPPSAYNSRPK